MTLFINKDAPLTEELVKHVLSQEIEIKVTSSKTKTAKHKKFTFNPWANEYSIWIGHERVDGGNALEELIIAFDEL